MSDQPMCFTCKVCPAGNDYGGTFSAYCAECQPRDPNPVPPGKAACRCAGCGLCFTSDSAFARHQTTDGGTVCHDPAVRGLVLVTRAAEGQERKLWGWPDSGRAGRPRR